MGEREGTEEERRGARARRARRLQKQIDALVSEERQRGAAGTPEGPQESQPTREPEGAPEPRKRPRSPRELIREKMRERERNQGGSGRPGRKGSG